MAKRTPKKTVATKRAQTGSAKPVSVKPVSAKPAASTKPDLTDVRAQIDGIDQQIQTLIAKRAKWAHQVGKAKGKLVAAVDYYRPEREAQVLRRVVDRNDGPLGDETLVRVFREIMSACLAQQELLKIGYLGPDGTFSQQAAHRHFGHSAKGLPLASFVARRGISMTRVESRPAHDALWQYAFFIDVAGHVDESPLRDALADIEASAGDVRILGSYPVAVL